MLGLVARYLSWNRQIADLEAASKFLDQLHSGWAMRVLNGGFSDLDDKGRAWFPVRVVTGNEDLVVTEQSAKGTYGEIDWYPLAFDHRSLVKPESDGDDRYKSAANFIEHCRASKAPLVLSQLRHMSDQIWKLRKEKMIRDWVCQISFGNSDSARDGDASLTDALATSGFQTFVVTSKHRQPLTRGPFGLGFALGEKAERDARDGKDALWVHGVRLAAVGEFDRHAVSTYISDELAKLSPSKLLDDAWVRIETITSSLNYRLIEGETTIGTDSIVRDFRIPPDAEHLIGEEVTLAYGFRSVSPLSVTSYTCHPPCLVLRCNVALILHGDIDYVTTTPHTFGGEHLDDGQENLGTKRKVWIETAGLMLPSSSVRILWAYRTGGRK